MIKLIGKVPSDIYVACSGGADSMAALDFLSNSKRKITVIHFDHGTEYGSIARKVVRSYCESSKIDMVVHEIKGSPGKNESLEAWWRDQRYEVLNSLDKTVVTGHNLNDVAEWWIFTSLRGNPRLMPQSTLNVIKPFLLTEKKSLELWCDRNDIQYAIDPSNFGNRFSRSKIRQKIMPEALSINPGFLTVMSKKIKERFCET